MEFVRAETSPETRSLCPECMKPISAGCFQVGTDVYMKKVCPDHGEFEVILWRGHPLYSGWARPKTPWYPEKPTKAVEKGCPFDCGLCPDHRQQTCTALIEVTQRCTLGCAYCFAGSGTNGGPDLDLSEIKSRFSAVLATGHACNIQLSGGEPTIRDDLPEIAAVGRAMGLGFIQVNSNGIRLASDPAYVEKLKENGVDSVFLQFDGTTDRINRSHRGIPLLELKRGAIENCRSQDIGVVLVPTVVPGVNDDDLGRIVAFAVEHIPVVRGVHFQPVSYFGRYPSPPEERHRITIPEIIRKLEVQTGGLIKAEDFGPPGCENAHCSFHGTFILMPDGKLKAFSRDEPSQSQCSCVEKRAEEGAEQSRRFVARQWGRPGKGECCNHENTLSLGYWDVILDRARTHTFCVSGMAFQDVWNIDLERLKDCCIHVVAEGGRLVPFCAYNLTSSSGRALYPRGGTQ